MDETRMKSLLNELDEKQSNDECLSEYQRGVFDTLNWLLYDVNVPEIED